MRQVILLCFLFLAALAVSGVLTGLKRRYALRLGILDIPNERSSHTQPTARGGGLAIVTTIYVGILGLIAADLLVLDTLGGLMVGALTIAIVGYIDDQRGLPAKHRLVVHIVAAAVAVVSMLQTEGFGASVGVFPAAIGAIVLIVAVVWSTNLFNFMDGIDGLAASEALFVSAASVVLVLLNRPSALTELHVLTAGATLGFLLWNWPPAKIFMGDVGSAFLGFWLAGLAVALSVTQTLPIWASMALGSAFIADATVTLLRRALSGRIWYQAHRSHAYQYLSRRWGSHLKVTTLLWTLNVAVSLPLATLSVLIPPAGPAAGIGSVIVFACAAAIAGAGKEEPARGREAL